MSSSVARIRALADAPALRLKMRSVKRTPSGLRLWHTTALVALLAGCMVGPDYKRPATEMPTTYPGAATEAGPNAALRVDWWTLFDDPVLNDLVTTALANNEDVQRAVARIEETDANLRAVDAALFPEIDVGGSATRSRSSFAVALPPPAGTPSVHNDLQLALSASFEIDFWGKLRREVEAAHAQALGSRYAKEVVTLSIASLTTQTYFSLRSLDAQIATTKNTLATRNDGLTLVKRRVDAGYASELDLRQAEGATTDASAQLKELIRQRALAQHLLGVLTGKVDLVIAPGDIGRLPLPPLPPPGLPSTLLERRPDVRMAEQNLVAENALVGVAIAQRFPTISLTGYYGGESQALAALFTGPGRIWAIGVGLTGPIFDAGKLAALADAERARYKQTLATYDQAIQNAFRDVADALNNVAQFAATESDLQASVNSAREALRLANRRYASGYSGYLEVLDSQRTANVSELLLIRNRQALLGADVDLMTGLGGGWQPAESTAAK
jgi:outer membrane protein, multidrug efflux system